MRHLTQSELAHMEARSFAHIVAAIGRAAELASPVGQRDQSRQGTPKAARMMARRNPDATS